jgi:outer membrane protein TolC
MVQLAACRGFAALCIALLAACTPLPYTPHSLDQDAALREYALRSVEDPGLAQFVRGTGYAEQWPPQSWSLDELTLAAIYFSAELRAARAQLQLAQAESRSAAQRPAVGAVPSIEHHSRTSDDAGPWSAGLALEFTVLGRQRRKARVEHAHAMEQAARVGVAQAAWRTRAQLRDALIELQDAKLRTALLERKLGAQREMRALVARRVEAGMLSARELSQEDNAGAALETALVVEQGRVRENEAAAARALQLPLEVLQRMPIARDALAASPASADAIALRARALRNRLDVREQLLAYAAADAEVKLAVAAQFPEIRLSPGYLWDQGDNVWSLAAGLVLPSTARNKAAIGEAQARRELAAQRFLALQAQVIGATGEAHERVAGARAGRDAAQRQAQAAREQLSRVERMFERGSSDRLQLTAARLAAAALSESEQQAATTLLRTLARLEETTQSPLLDSGFALRAAVAFGAAQ